MSFRKVLLQNNNQVSAMFSLNVLDFLMRHKGYDDYRQIFEF